LILLDGPILEAGYDEIMEFKSEIRQGIRGDLARLSVFSTERVIGPAPDPRIAARARAEKEKRSLLQVLHVWLERRKANKRLE